jgi:hypothetical protein
MYLLKFLTNPLVVNIIWKLQYGGVQLPFLKYSKIYALTLYDFYLQIVSHTYLAVAVSSV